MAGSSNLPAKSSDSPPKAEVRRDKIRKLVRNGYTSGEIAEKLGGDDQRKKKIIRREVRMVMAQDEEFKAQQVVAASGQIMENLEPVVGAVIGRAKRGRVDAAKLLLEMSGVHNPKVQHEHSGDISVTLKGIPRPGAVETEDSVVDADVVEE